MDRQSAPGQADSQLAELYQKIAGARGGEVPDALWTFVQFGEGRQVRMSAGVAPRGSSPAAQEALGLNHDATFSPESGEGEKLRHEQ